MNIPDKPPVARRPFLYMGSKWGIARYYPRPKFGTIIEPFAGSAGYSLHWWDRQVTLVDADSTIANIWKWLTTTTKQEVLALPDECFDVRGVKLPQPVLDLIGFWNGVALTQPAVKATDWVHRPSAAGSYGWMNGRKYTIASILDKVRHWQVIRGDYAQSPDVEATWFIDPPYDNAAGRNYKEQVANYGMLRDFCLSRKGQVIVCENEGATWLPFKPLGTFKGAAKGFTKEVIWTNG